MRYAVVMPVYNEAPLFAKAFDRLIATPPVAGHERIIVIVNDGSTDGTREIIDRCCNLTSTPEPHDPPPHSHTPTPLPGVITLHHTINQGKGAAIRTGFRAALDAGADIILIHDADLEYDPADHTQLLTPIIDGRADAVIGSRFIGGTHRVLYYWHAVVNRALTTLSNMLTNLNLTDIECCLKAFNRQTAARLDITEKRFGLEPELIAKTARMRTTSDAGPGRADQPLRIYEVPVSYAGRTYAEGKKIGWRDGLDAIRCILKYNIFP